MDSEDTHFSRKVYTWRNRKTLKKDVSLANSTANVTKVSETLYAELLVMVVLQTDQNHLITNFTERCARRCKIEEASSCSGGEVVTISLNESKSICKIRNVRRRLEGYISDGFRRYTFLRKVYTRRNRKTLKKDVSTTIVTINVTKVSETLDADLPWCGGGYVSLNESESIGEIRNVARRLEGELDHVRALSSFVIWELWRKRNRMKHERKQTSVARIIHNVTRNVYMLVRLRKPRIPVHIKWSDMLIEWTRYIPKLKIKRVLWEFPPNGWVKYNIDGALRENSDSNSMFLFEE
ncbi:hypothetical protein H5410_048830 [Solanum commersonii]|uniref:Uncharacterized protein n=1 Tax=Solanum commersonii TaxID=4109 RepID=A0A9J5XM48_SOLCO|nr:hypothetical protein H5410_048830 [Solanum commersonii]